MKNPKDQSSEELKTLFMSKLGAMLKTWRPQIVDIQTITITKHPQKIRGLKYDYDAKIEAVGAKKAPLVFDLQHQEVCTWEPIPKPKTKKRR